jgi:arginase family enzyme
VIIHVLGVPMDLGSGRRGVDIAALLGYGVKALTGAAGSFPKLEPENVALVGIRSLDPGEKRRLKETGVQAIRWRTSTNTVCIGLWKRLWPGSPRERTTST